MNEARQSSSIKEVVESGLCIGCGLCEALAPSRWRIEMTSEGRLRPAPAGDEDLVKDHKILLTK